MWKGVSHDLNVNIAGNTLEKNENGGKRNCSKYILYIKVTESLKDRKQKMYRLVFRHKSQRGILIKISFREQMYMLEGIDTFSAIFI